MFNFVGLLGRLAEEPELKYTQSGISVLKFDLAVKSGFKKENFPYYIPIVCWRESAEFVARHMHKGQQVLVEGRLTARKYTDKDGNNRKAVEVTAHRIHFADSKPPEYEAEIYTYDDLPYDDSDLL